MTKETANPCRMGSKMPKPCPFPATVPMPDLDPEEGPTLCEFHAALVPHNEQIDQLSISLSLTRTYLKAVRRQPMGLELEGVLERAAADFEARLELAQKTVRDLKVAEYELIR